MTFLRRYSYLLIALLAIAIDQLTKEVAIASLSMGQAIPVIDGILWWRLAYNDSAAFSLGFGQTWILAIISFIAMLATIWYSRKISSRSWQITAGVFLGGVVGNLIDRLTREPGFGIGHVVDFIQIPFNFPVFNLADTFIFTMASLTVIRVMRGENVGGLPTKVK
ncbi:MAG: signal peptidase II [Actinomycetota bacterium]